jgi:very-short-patch-repair endonuclease
MCKTRHCTESIQNSVLTNIIEVDGKIHDKEFLRTPDRIRQRALENMSYEAYRVRNDQVQNAPHVVSEDIILT